jgi:hypothetical protein
MHIRTTMTRGIFQVLRFELTMLVVAIGFLDRDGDGIEDVCRLLENSVHLLQGAIAGFREEKVHEGEYERVSVAVSSRMGPCRQK